MTNWVTDQEATDWNRWRVVAASATGREHALDGRQCQDAFRNNYHDLVDAREVTRGRDLPFVAVVSDGLSSASEGATGASLVAGMAFNRARRIFETAGWYPEKRTAQDLRDRMRDVVVGTCAIVKTTVDSLVDSEPGRTFGATLLVAVFRPPWLVCANIGDGFALGQRSGGELFTVCRPQKDPKNAGRTPTIFSDQADTAADVVCVFDPRLEAFALSSDGLDKVSFDRNAPARPSETFYRPLFNGMHDGSINTLEATRFLRSDDLSKVTLDDVTVVALGRAGQEGCP